MWPVLRSDLRSRIRELADVESATDRHTDAKINSHINKNLAYLWDIIVRKNQDYLLTTESFPLTSGDTTYPLPPTFYKMRGVVIDKDGFTYHPQPFHLQDIDHTSSNVSWGIYGSTLKYRIIGTDFVLNTIPSQDYPDTTIYYTPIAPQYTDDIAAVDFVNGWDEFIVAHVAWKLVEIDKRQDSPNKLAMANKEEKRILDAAIGRTDGEPERVLRRDIYIPWHMRR